MGEPMIQYLKQLMETGEQNQLQESIISQARLIYGPQYPTAHTFDVFIAEAPDDEENDETIGGSIARLVVFTRENSFADCKVLLHTKREEDADSALQALDSMTSTKAVSRLEELDEDYVEEEEMDSDDSAEN